ncbi:hypothetical protein ACFL6Y_00275 [Elusimicrobiota bacterium]
MKIKTLICTLVLSLTISSITTIYAEQEGDTECRTMHTENMAYDDPNKPDINRDNSVWGILVWGPGHGYDEIFDQVLNADMSVSYAQYVDAALQSATMLMICDRTVDGQTKNAVYFADGNGKEMSPANMEELRINVLNLHRMTMRNAICGALDREDKCKFIKAFSHSNANILEPRKGADCDDYCGKFYLNPLNGFEAGRGVHNKMMELKQKPPNACARSNYLNNITDNAEISGAKSDDIACRSEIQTKTYEILLETFRSSIYEDYADEIIEEFEL